MPRPTRNATSVRRFRNVEIAKLVELLEPRQLLSGVPGSVSRIEGQYPFVSGSVSATVSKQAKTPYNQLVVSGNKLSTALKPTVFDQPLVTKNAGVNSSTPAAGALTPTQLRTAYGVSSITDEGQGMTIGIVDEYDDPDAISDANTFSSEYSLPQFNGTGEPTLTVYKDTTYSTVPTAPTGTTGPETSLDIDMAHSMAPDANILLVEVPATGTAANAFQELLQGVQYAASQGAQVVSLSYGYPEASIGTSSVSSLNSTFLASGAASGVAVTVSSGDYSTPLYPATSPNALAVGGTALHLASVKGKYSFETAWGGLYDDGAGGGGTSSVFSTPSFQSSNGVNYGARSIPDVSMDADPITGVSVYDSFDSGYYGTPWLNVGGTSAAAPLFAGIVSLAQQARIAKGETILNSVQINNAMYSAYNSSSYSTYFHDVNLGNNSDPETDVTGFSAGTGYDEATGIGSPQANTLVPYLTNYTP